jgi:hypothetical protein
MIRRLGAFTLVASSVLTGCGALLGIPEDPYVEDPDARGSMREQPDGNGQPTALPDPDNGATDPGTGAATGAELDMTAPVATELLGDVEMDPGTASTDTEPPPETPAEETETCVPRSQRRAVDILLVADNSGSMAAEAEALERSINPAFASVLDEAEVDYRLVLLSRQRVAERSASEEASTSICVTTPLSSLAECPAPEPVPSERFLHYSIKIESGDSFDRILDTFGAPDPLGFTLSGWSERLRADSLKIVIEFSDADATLPLGDFLARLSALAPEHFGSDPAAPTFVFHSVIGVLQKAIAIAPYAPDEPVEEQRCSSAADGPDNAGPTYQALSRLTGGLRFPICPTLGLPFVMLALANDVIERSFVPCETQ